MRGRFMIGGVIVVALAMAAAFGVWYVAIRDDALPEVSLTSALDAARSAAPQPTPGSVGGIEGTWIVAPGGSSFVGYRVNEQLVGIGAATAVGRTTAVTGNFELNNNSVISGKVEANMAALQSDDSRRDRALRTQAIETSSYPTAIFVLTEPIILKSALSEGASFEATAAGDITLHGVTRRIAIELKGQMSERQIVVVGSTLIVFADYGITPPNAFSVVSVENRGVLEVQLVLSRKA